MTFTLAETIDQVLDVAIAKEGEPAGTGADLPLAS
jgi:hypothetical protein